MADKSSLCIWGPTENPGEQQWILERRAEDKVVLRNLKFNKYAGVNGTLEPSAEVFPTFQPIELTMQAVDEEHYKLWVETNGGKLYFDCLPSAHLPPRLAWVAENVAQKSWKFNPVA